MSDISNSDMSSVTELSSSSCTRRPAAAANTLSPINVDNFFCAIQILAANVKDGQTRTFIRDYIVLLEHVYEDVKDLIQTTKTVLPLLSDKPRLREATHEMIEEGRKKLQGSFYRKAASILKLAMVVEKHEDADQHIDYEELLRALGHVSKYYAHEVEENDVDAGSHRERREYTGLSDALLDNVDHQNSDNDGGSEKENVKVVDIKDVNGGGGTEMDMDVDVEESEESSDANDPEYHDADWEGDNEEDLFD